MSVQFGFGADMGEAMQEVRDRVAAVQAGFPREAPRPTIARRNKANSSRS